MGRVVQSGTTLPEDRQNSMSRLIIERYVYDALNARATLDGDVSDDRRELALNILRDIDIYFADHMEDLCDARARLAERDDPESREMLILVDATLAEHAKAETIAREAIARAGNST